MGTQCWANGADSGPTLSQDRVNVYWVIVWSQCIFGGGVQLILNQASFLLHNNEIMKHSCFLMFFCQELDNILLNQV